MADNPLTDLYSGEWQQAIGPSGVPRITISPPKGNPLTDLYSSAGGQHAEPPDQQVKIPSQAQPQPEKVLKGVGQVVAPSLTNLYTGEYGTQPQKLPEQGKIPQVDPTTDTTVGAAMDVAGLGPGPEKLLPAMAVGGIMHGAGPIEGAKALNSLFNPTATPIGKEASMALRKATGESARTTAMTADILGQYDQQINALSPQDRLNLIEYAETRSSKKPATIAPELQAAADEYRKAMEKRQQMIANAGIEAGVIKDFVSHAGIWKDPRQAEQVFGSAFKQGSGAALKKRTIPTVSEGIKLGLEPVTDNLLEIGMRYVTNMDRHIGMHEMLQAGEQAGHVINRPQDMRDIPEGWVELQGMGRNRYAAPEWATIWNNFVSRGFYENPHLGTAYQSFRNLSNLTTQSILGLSGYHAVTMAMEAIASDLIKGLGEAYGGASIRDARQILAGGKTIGKTVIPFYSPVQKARTGKKLAEVYLGRTPNTIDPRDLPNWQKMAKVYAEAGGRAVGKSHAQDFTFTAAGNFSSAWRRGFLKAEMAQAPGTFSKAGKDAYEAVRKAGGSQAAARKAADKAIEITRQTVQLVSRSMSTLMAPLFDKYIPLLKNGAFADEFQMWLKMNPNATHEEQVRFAAKLIDSIDNRFGEMIQDNIFWHTTAKQLATIGMLSYSWNLGSARLIFGGMKDISRTSLNPASPNYSPNAAWIVAYPMAVAMAAAIYQYAKTGKGPEKPMDLIMPQTGGTAPGFGQHGTVPQIAILPGYQKEPFGWFYNGVVNEAINKANPFARMLIQTLTNSDWKGDPIKRPFATTDEAIADYLTYFVKSTIPITLGRIGQGEAPGSSMGLGEQLTGIRPGPLYESDPRGYAKGMSSMELRKWDKKIDYDVKHHIKTPEEGKRLKAEAKKRQLQYGGPQQ